VRAENPAALRFILQEDIYLLKSDTINLQAAPVVSQPAEAELTQPVAAPAAEIKQPEPATQTPVIIPAKETSAPAYNYLGENKKQFLILTHYANEDVIAADHLAALQNIFKRKEYDMGDIAILNIAKATGTSIIDLITYFKPEKVLILGAAAVPAGMGVPPLNQLKKMKNGVLLPCVCFDEMMSSTDNKKAFWDQMKNF
jgi:hypothetical protein